MNTDPPPKKRRRDPEASQAAILAAARAAFAERGYARATIREIAQRAGVTHGLVMRHFPSKEQLFIAAMPGAPDLVDLVPGTPETLPHRIARAYVDRMERADGNDPFIALIRSAASDEQAATKLYVAMRARSTEAYRQVVTGPDADVRIDLLGAHLIGVTFSRYIVKSGTLADMPPGALVDHLTRTLRGILAIGA
ncbi:TetR family transcriptional regulator [Streptomyces sp. WAC06614]|uniref:TetR/AcrR family transcriptional regulator n=1 Tax=Streptomyces sp. WAC06614 TaxID=2487416 RepID=UPI000F7A98B8|nr:TetR family transcriptional regulator [Streptomyces sp. WAC06614]RSS70280.1 TetR/AcrR family transcriptional regulator [Streptomyces sp. WAC06614]